MGWRSCTKHHTSTVVCDVRASTPADDMLRQQQNLVFIETLLIQWVLIANISYTTGYSPTRTTPHTLTHNYIHIPLQKRTCFWYGSTCISCHTERPFSGGRYRGGVAAGCRRGRGGEWPSHTATGCHLPP